MRALIGSLALSMALTACDSSPTIEPLDAFVTLDAATSRDAFAAGDAFTPMPDAHVSGDDAFVRDAAAPLDGGTDAASLLDGGTDAFVPIDGGSDAGCAATETLCAAACVDTRVSVVHCGDCTTVCTTATDHAHATCAASACGEACDSGYVASGGACVLDVLDHFGMPTSIPLGDYRAFRGHLTSFQYDEYAFVLDAPAHVQIDLMGNVQAALTAAQIASGDATTSSPSGYHDPSPANWSVDDSTGASVGVLCWSQDGFSCSHEDTQDIRYLRRNAASDGMWDGDVDMVPAGSYQIRVARGVNSGPSDYETLYYYGEIVITPD